jgi:hypothetical protein
MDATLAGWFADPAMPAIPSPQDPLPPWLLDELHATLQALDDGVRQFVQVQQQAQSTDLAEVDPTSLRLCRQRLRQGAGALATQGLDGTAHTLRALDAVLARLVQRPASATPELAAAVAQGVAVVLAALQRRARGVPGSELALFPTYERWQQLAGAAPAHPADLWRAPPWTAPPLWPPGKSYQPGPVVRAHWDRLVLPVVQAGDTRAAATLALLCAGLGRGSADEAPRQFWLAAAAYFEALAARALPAADDARRTPLRILRQYVQLAQGRSSGLAALTHELLFWAAQAFAGQDEVASAPCWSALRRAWGNALLPVWDYHATVPDPNTSPADLAVVPQAEPQLYGAAIARTPSPGVVDPVPGGGDGAGTVVDALDVPAPAASGVAPPLDSPATCAPATAIATPAGAPGLADAVTPIPVPVASDWLQRLTAHTGDVDHSRAQLEAQWHTLQHACHDMACELERWRAQLRDLAPDAPAAPELARWLAASVQDLAAVQRRWQHALTHTGTTLAAQARHSRALQQDVLRARLLPADSITERLQRALRDAAQAQGTPPMLLEIQGGALMLDCGLLERLLPVLERLLRHVAVHGMSIQSPDPAAALRPGDAAHNADANVPCWVPAALTLAWQQRGHDISVALADGHGGRAGDACDTGGVGAVWAATSVMPTTDAPEPPACAPPPSPAEAPGLDALAQWVRQLGGRLQGSSSPGAGTCVELVLPWCAAVTRVVLLRVADVVLAVPAPWISGVQRASAAELALARATGRWVAPHPEGSVPFESACEVLGLLPDTAGDLPASGQRWGAGVLPASAHEPVLVFHGGGQHVAWQVDEVLGHQEVWVQPAGPQLAQLPGVVGATVLASGLVALLYDPVRVSACYRVVPPTGIEPVFAA